MHCVWPQLGRCCFFMPLRKGVLTFGYIHMLFNAFMIFMFGMSFSDEINLNREWFVLYSRYVYLPPEFCFALVCFEVIFDGLLIYGAHKKDVWYLKVYFYYAFATGVAVLVIQFLEGIGLLEMYFFYFTEMLFIVFTTLCIQIYLITLVRSLIKMLEISSPIVHETELLQIVSGEFKNTNEVYNNTTVEPTELVKGPTEV